MDPVGSSAGALSSNSAGLESWSGSKKIKVHIESIYLHSSSYKKTKLPGVSGGIVDSSDGLLSVGMLHSDGVELQRSWGSEVDSEKAGVSEVSDAENLESMVAEEMSYIDLNTSETDEIEDNATSRKMQTRTFVLEWLPKTISFTNMSDDDTELVLSGAKFAGFNWLPPVISHVLERRAFKPVKLFTLDVELSNVPGKTNSDKSSFTSEISLNKARELAVNEKILVNDNLKKANIHSNWKIIVKEIPVDLPKSAVELVFFKFDKIISIKIQLIGLWQKALVEFDSSEIVSLVAFMWSVSMGKNSVRVALAVEDKQTCAVVCFENEAAKLVATGSVPVFRGVNLHWAGLFLACCAICKHFGHVGGNYSVDGNSGSHERQVVTDQDCLHGADAFFGAKVLSVDSFSHDVSGLNDHLAVLECSLKLLADQVSDILKRLSGIKLVLLAAPSHVFSLKVFAFNVPISGLDMAVDTPLPSSNSSHLVSNSVIAELGPSSSKILTSKISGLESKLSALEVSVGSVLMKLDLLCSADVVHWHVSSGNMMSSITETKLKSSIGLWIKGEYNGVHIFTSGLEVGFLGTGVAIVTHRI
ncbi:hypothetical protein G9A89_007515 [Geosiphon pyriformis]|nr:hypothetical protein G9A89_007515 [Geosiphon pyriformis]